ncbi:hypothetical protein GIB67_031914 [Kingdonia uniflora]|uniref:Phosphatidylserine decarboxylase proenzyme 2 n=1 Tax=Kingdonia uniflora TaxID=39325 RepID=A0A7J7NTI0_9MAGN|nr:hypothetical protein GIB67_031914 [Kingdonia uniflora]
MGHGSSKSTLPDSKKKSESSRSVRLGRRFHGLLRHRSGSGSSHSHITLEDFTGIVLIGLISAEMKFKDKWFACVSLGERTFRTSTSDQVCCIEWGRDKMVSELGTTPPCPSRCTGEEKKLLLERNGSHIARISVFETNKMSKNNLVGYCEIDLFDILSRDSDTEIEVLDLLDVSPPNSVVGSISVSFSFEDPVVTERNFARRILSIVDYNDDGELSFSEFDDLIKAFGNRFASSKKKELFKAADKNGDGVVSIEELADLLAIQQEKEALISSCPVCGEILGNSDRLNDMIHLTLCFDEGTGNQIMTGGFLTDKQASYGWLFKMSEWVRFSSYDIGLNSGSSAASILVFDRKTKRLVEELIDGKIVLSMRALYQSKIGLSIIDTGAKEILQNISEKQGRRMNSVASAKEIPKFIELFKDQLYMSEVKYPIEHFKTFNEFFIRELKPSARPIASLECDDLAICAADSRLMAFKSTEDSLRFWIKGRKFSIEGLLGKDVYSSAFTNGSLVIFRLAPQDYHRFHVPVSGTIEKFVSIPGCLYTVNPIAVNSKYCNVFTENKRDIAVISTVDFGKVAFVAIGATMVGSITFSRKKGDYVQKGDELGYFSFGGSTVICVFEKDVISIDEDLLQNSERSLETLVTMGMTLGVSRKKRVGIASLPKVEHCILGE